MPRLARKYLESSFVHIIVQGLDRQYIFKGNFLKSLYRTILKKNISETIKYLTINGNGQTIKKDFSLILQGSSNDSERIVSELKEYLKTVTNGQYELSKIEPLINLLKNIR